MQSHDAKWANATAGDNASEPERTKDAGCRMQDARCRSQEGVGENGENGEKGRRARQTRAVELRRLQPAKQVDQPARDTASDVPSLKAEWILLVDSFLLVGWEIRLSTE